jgi:hypothetical protein
MKIQNTTEETTAVIGETVAQTADNIVDEQSVNTSKKVVEADKKTIASSGKVLVAKITEGWGKAASAAAGFNFVPAIIMGIAAAALGAAMISGL